MPLIECKNLNLSYEGLTVIENINFALNNGDYLCIVGENGSGKSTLIKTLLGLHKASSGDVIFNEIHPNEIGYLPQQSLNKGSFPASVYEVTLSGRLNKKKLHPFYTKADKEAADKNLKMLDVFHLKNRCFGELSGGQQQRVLLARALCATSKLILLDEPVASLDPIATNEFYSVIEHLNKAHNLSVIMVSHDISAAINNASHILHLSRDNSFFGSTEEYKKSDIILGGKI